MYVCMYVCIYVFTYVFMYVSMCVRVCECVQVQQHTPPGPLEYDTALRPDKIVYTIFLVGHIIIIMPVKADEHNHVLFSVSPSLPRGLDLDQKTGAITGTPSATTGKVVYTITARNLRGQDTIKISFAVSGDWQTTHPKEWSVEMWQTWFKNELKLAEDQRSHLFKLNSAQLILLQSPEAVASKCPGLQASSQVLIGRSVADLLRK